MLYQSTEEPFWARAFASPGEADRYWGLVTEVAFARWADDVLLDRAAGSLTLPDGACANIANLAADAARHPQEVQRTGLYSFFSHFESLHPQKTVSYLQDWERAHSALRVRLWAGDLPFQCVATELSKSVRRAVVVDHEAGAMPLAREHFDHWGVTEEEVWRTALENTRCHLERTEPNVTAGARGQNNLFWFSGDLFTTGLAFDLSAVPMAVGSLGALLCAPVSHDLIVVPVNRPEDCASLSLDMARLALPVHQRQSNPLSVDQFWYRAPGDLVPILEFHEGRPHHVAPEPMYGWMEEAAQRMEGGDAA